MRTLIIEDDRALAALLGCMLDQMGIEVCGNEATEEGAVRAAEARSPDLIIADVNLRMGTGIGAVSRILKRRPVRYIFVSADLTQPRVTYPSSIMLQKPYVFGQMASAIKSAMAN